MDLLQALSQSRIGTSLRAFSSRISNLPLLPCDSPWLRNRLPLAGTVSYVVINLHISLDGGISSLIGCFDTRVVNLCLLTSHVGMGSYLFQQESFMKSSVTKKRVLGATYVATMFNLGSILLVALLKDYLPQSGIARSSFALLWSYGIITTGLNVLRANGMVNE